MSRPSPGGRPQGADRDFLVEPEFNDTPDLHLLTQALLNLAINRAKDGKPPLTRPDAVTVGPIPS